MSDMGWTAADLDSFDGRTVVVTGANSGLGLETSRELARVGARVVMAVRDLERGRRAAASIGGTTDVRRLDLADLASVRAFAEDWDGPIDVLINNAGVMNVPLGRTTDGFETQIGVNHLGPFALTNLLLPHLNDRVVTVSSALERVGRIDLTDLNWNRRRYRRVAAYGQSKLANLLFATELQRRLDRAGSPVRSLSVHPGYASTNLQMRTQNRLFDLGGRAANALFGQSAAAGAWPSLYAASRDIPGGAHVGPGQWMETRGHPQLVGRSNRAGDGEMGKHLWDLSEELTGVTAP